MATAFLRSITTVHTNQIEQVIEESFWKQLLPTWSFLETHDDHKETERMKSVRLRLNEDAQKRMQGTQTFLLEDVDRPFPNECLININPLSKEVTIRIFGRFLTDVQSTSEWFIYRLLTADQFIITRHTRCFIVLNIQGERTDLTTGRVMPLGHRLWRNFYSHHRYNIHITGTVFCSSLAIFLLTDGIDTNTAIGKFYSISGRILPAAMMNIFLLIGQFYHYKSTRKVIEWEKP